MMLAKVFGFATLLAFSVMQAGAVKAGLRTSEAPHYTVLTDPFLKGVQNGDVDDWAAIIAMFGAKIRQGGFTMSIVLCEDGEKRLQEFQTSEDDLVVAARVFCNENDIQVMSEDMYVERPPLQNEVPLVHAPLRANTIEKVAKYESIRVQGSTIDDWNIKTSEEKGRGVLAEIAAKKGWASALTGIKFKTRDTCPPRELAKRFVAHLHQEESAWHLALDLFNSINYKWTVFISLMLSLVP